VRVRKLDMTLPEDVSTFINFPFRLYRHTPQWVPPLVSAARSSLDPNNHPFYQHSSADFFVVEEGRQVLGRIGVMHNTRHNAYRQCQVAFFGFFEVVDDVSAAQLLFNTAFEWAQRRGLNEIIGPRGLIGADSSGILVEGFDLRPALDVPYNLAYYDDYLKDSGFVKDTDHFCGYLPGDHQIPPRLAEMVEKARQRHGFTIKSFTTQAELRQWVPYVAEVHQKSFTETHEYFPPTPAEVEWIADTIISVTDPRLIKLAMKGDQVVGFALAYHDIAPALQKCRGRLLPLGWYYILQERKRADWVNLNGVALLPEYRGQGANLLLYSELAKSIHAIGFKHMELIQVNETNYQSRSDMEAIGARWYKRHRSYRRSL
jgi:GNAT superfamily N-acetyltransferase